MEIVQVGSLIGLFCVFAGMITMLTQHEKLRRRPKSGWHGALYQLMLRFTHSRGT